MNEREKQLLDEIQTLHGAMDELDGKLAAAVYELHSMRVEQGSADQSSKGAASTAALSRWMGARE